MKSGNICDLSNLDTRDLIEELQNRGYMTGLLFCREDVETQLDSIREGYPGLELTMTEEQIDDILDGDIPTGWCCERINDSLYDAVFKLFSEEINTWEENDYGIKMRNGFGQ
jgi:hypothetical protein